jgi:hypothetical protein
MEEKPSGFFNDDGTEINPELVPKPSLCLTCRKDDDSSQINLCTLTRADQADDPEFCCDAYEAKNN